MIPWGNIVCGITVTNDSNEEWLKVGDRYLPKNIDGVVVLRPYLHGQDGSGSKRSHGSRERSRSRGRSLPAVAPMLLDPIPESSSSSEAPPRPTEDETPAPAAKVCESVLASSSGNGLHPEKVISEVSQNVISCIMANVREAIREEVATFVKELQEGLRQPGGATASETSKPTAETSSPTGPESVAIHLNSQIKDHIEEVAKKLVDELWQGNLSTLRGKPGSSPANLSTSRGSGIDQLECGSRRVSSAEELKTSASPRPGGSITSPAPLCAATSVPSSVTPTVPSSVNFLFQDPRSRPNSFSLGQPPTSIKLPNLSSGGSPERTNSHAPPSSPERINMPFSMEVRRAVTSAQPGPSRGMAMANVISPSPSTSPLRRTEDAPRGRRMSSPAEDNMHLRRHLAAGSHGTSQASRPVMPGAPRAATLAAPFQGFEAMQRLGSTPSASSLPVQRSVSGPSSQGMPDRHGLSVSPSPATAPRHISPGQAPAARYPMPFAAGQASAASTGVPVSRQATPLSIQRGLRNASPDSYMEFDAQGRPLATILSV